MTKSYWQRTMTLAFCLGVFISLAGLTGLAQQSRNKSTPPPRPVADFKISEKTTTGGQTFEGTTMIKGARQRTETNNYGQDMTSIVQCDLKRTIQINEQSRKYMITPMAAGDSGNGSESAAAVGPAAPRTTGGIINYIINTTDTGERKEMFGFTARHVKSSMMIEPSPDACMKDKMRMERDGWYVDLQYGLNCGLEGPPQRGRPMAPGGCQDQVRFRRSGAGKIGYPLIETTTIYGANGSPMSSTTKEVIELSRQPLDVALFELPAGYTEAASFQEMYMPSADTTGTGNYPGQQSPGTMGTATAARAAGGIRVGVVAINNKTDHAVSGDSLRARLIGEISGSGVEAIPLNSTSAPAADAEAKAKRCDFVLYTDISALKTASAGKKLGGMFGRAVGADTGGMGKSESRVDFKLFPTGSAVATLNTSATGKEEGDEVSVGAALEREGQAVAAAVRKH
ncbi:MAG: hypothetical protein ABJC05_04490 [Pyrinomonadaceae bacterium]